MERPLLNDSTQFPSETILQSSLNECYKAYTLLFQHLAEIQLSPQWNYYKDGKAWLCKVCLKKKTIFWLSVWPNSFNVTFYFTEKNSSALFDLDISADIMTDFTTQPPIGKLKPLTIKVYGEQQLKDILTISTYKSTCK